MRPFYADPGTDPDYCDRISDQPERCIYCNEPMDDDSHAPYCSTQCAINAEDEQ